MKAKIYKPAKTTMQSGRAGAAKWVLEYELETPRRPNDLMGWTSAGDTLNQVSIKFDSKEAAIAFAESRNMQYTVTDPQARKVKPQTYLDNFKYRPAEQE